jgi:hypothetical protein
MFTFLDQRKQAKMQWVLNPSQSNVNKLDNVTREARRHSGNKKKEYSITNIDEVVGSSKI